MGGASGVGKRHGEVACWPSTPPDKADKIEIQYWEWNGPPWPEIGGLQTLATALFAADALGEMARSGVKAAIQYNLQEHSCGLIPGWEQDDPKSWPTQKWNGRTIRPIAFAIQMWTKEMGQILVESSITHSGHYTTKDWHTLVNYQGEVPLLSAHATRSNDAKSLQLLVVNRDEKNAIQTDLIIKGFTPAQKATIITLNGPSPLSHNDVTNHQPPYHSYPDAPDPIVKLTHTTQAIPGPTFNYSFPAHSATVIRLQAK